MSWQRTSHNPEVAGSNPASATSTRGPALGPRSRGAHVTSAADRRRPRSARLFERDRTALEDQAGADRALRPRPQRLRDRLPPAKAAPAQRRARLRRPHCHEEPTRARRYCLLHASPAARVRRHPYGAAGPPRRPRPRTNAQAQQTDDRFERFSMHGSWPASSTSRSAPHAPEGGGVTSQSPAGPSTVWTAPG